MMKITKCTTCGSTDLREAWDEKYLVIDTGGLRCEADIPYTKCTKCGEGFYDNETLEFAEREAAKQVVISGIATDKAFRFLRTTLGLRAIDLATMIDVSPATISRWEHGEVPVDRRAMAILGTMMLEKLEGGIGKTRAVLGALADPVKEPRTIGFSMRKIDPVKDLS